MNKIKKIVKKIIPKKYYKFIIEIKKLFSFDNYAIKSYSQEGEDMILRRIFEGRKTVGFYIDVGAHHPKRFSNSYFFYKKGWRGINIDAMPGCMNFFKKIRPRDINLELALSDKKQVLSYYMFNESALNSFSKKLSNNKNKEGRYRIIKKINMETTTLAEVLDNYLPNGLEIDFISIDVEGLDLQILNGNNWIKYKPKIILIESLKFSFSNLKNSKIYTFLNKRGYHLFAKTVNTLFLINDSFTSRK